MQCCLFTVPESIVRQHLHPQCRRALFENAFTYPPMSVDRASRHSPSTLIRLPSQRQSRDDAVAALHSSRWRHAILPLLDICIIIALARNIDIFIAHIQERSRPLGGRVSLRDSYPCLRSHHEVPVGLAGHWLYGLGQRTECRARQHYNYGYCDVHHNRNPDIRFRRCC